MSWEQITIVVLAAIAAVGGIYFVKRKWGDRFAKLFAIKRRVDSWQQEVVEFATLLAKWLFPFGADIAGKVSAIAIGEAIKAMRDLRLKLMEPGGMLRALTENFYYQIPLRCEDEADVKRLAAAVAKEPKLMAAVAEIQAEQKQTKADATPPTVAP